MSVPINIMAVFIAAVASMALGALWYSPLAFGNVWAKMTWSDPKHLAAQKKKGMGKGYAIAFLGSLVMAFVLAHAIEFAGTYLNVAGASAGLMSGFWNWLGFIVPVSLGSVLWEGKSWKLWAINSGYHLVQLLMMGTILAMWQM